MRRKSGNLSPGKQSAFTLVEVVISISILTIILSTAYSAITQIIGTKRILDDKRDITIVAHSLIRRLGKELQLTTSDNPIIFSSTASNSSAANVKFLGSTKGGGGSSDYDDSLTFVALEGGQYLPDGGIHTGLVQITYRLGKDPEKNLKDQYSLIREEIPYAQVPNSNDPKAWEDAKKKAFEKRMVFPVAENVAAFTLKYYDLDQSQWTNEWGTNQKEIPAMVYYSVTLVSPLGNSETYATAVPISAGR